MSLSDASDMLEEIAEKYGAEIEVTEGGKKFTANSRDAILKVRKDIWENVF